MADTSLTRSAQRAMVDRLVRTYQNAPADAASRGLAWYGEAWDAAVDMCPADPYRAAGVIAALSPRLQWTTNVRAARAMFDGADYTAGIPAQRAKARRILNGEDPLAVLNGPKERAFYLNIIGDADMVTVDMWAWQAARRRDDVRSHVPANLYDTVADAYRTAAARVGVAPREFQAAVWLAVRNA